MGILAVVVTGVIYSLISMMSMMGGATVLLLQQNKKANFNGGVIS